MLKGRGALLVAPRPSGGGGFLLPHWLAIAFIAVLASAMIVSMSSSV